jgi:hypothetical protein
MKSHFQCVSKVFLLSILLSFSLTAQAQFEFLGLTGKDDKGLNSEREKFLRQRAKNRAYPGGRDEEAMKVQAQLPPAMRKMLPAQEPLEEAAEPDAADNSND